MGATTAARARMPTVPTQLMARRVARPAPRVSMLSANPPCSAIQVCQPAHDHGADPYRDQRGTAEGVVQQRLRRRVLLLGRPRRVTAEQEQRRGRGHDEVEERLPGGGEATEPAGRPVGVGAHEPDQAEGGEADRGAGKRSQAERGRCHRPQRAVGVDLAAAGRCAGGEGTREVGQQQVEECARHEPQPRGSTQRPAAAQSLDGLPDGHQGPPVSRAVAGPHRLGPRAGRNAPASARNRRRCVPVPRPDPCGGSLSSGRATSRRPSSAAAPPVAR